MVISAYSPPSQYSLGTWNSGSSEQSAFLGAASSGFGDVLAARGELASSDDAVDSSPVLQPSDSLPQGKGDSGLATPFIDGSLFGYATPAPVNLARNGLQSPETLASAQSGERLSEAQDVPAEAKTSRGAALPPALDGAPLSQSQAVSEADTVIGHAVSVSAGGDEPASAAVEAESGKANLPPATPVLSGSRFMTLDTLRSTAGQASDAEDQAMSRSQMAEPMRQETIENLVPMNVTVSLGRDGSGVQILARVSGLAANEEDTLERGLRAVVAQHGSAVAALRLNGVERAAPVEN